MPANTQKDLTKRQHYHMRAILKNFAVGEMLHISRKDGTTDELSYEDKAFYGHVAWSDETETKYGELIERRFLGQATHIFNTHRVCAHHDISEYHIFWRLRHMYAIDPMPVTKIYEGFDFGTLEELKDWCNRNGKIYVNGDGTIDGMFAATLKIRESLDRYRKEYEGVYWSVGIAENGGLISADNYKNSLILPLSPSILLCGKRTKNKKPWIMTVDDINQANQMAIDQCHDFCFSKPNSDDATAS
ncbi:hypothetical protein [Pseudomonas sp. PS01297]|uniref:hypothetical protein n=1 Tax=Pseudomonas sp. PS01297 TaxID=2991433 RepID=UPI00249B2398|nr:hypothetical protein [Pseudomonas sp. PS01297]